MAYFCLNHDGCVDLCGGDLTQCGVGLLDNTKPVDEQLVWLTGLLPTEDKPVVITNTQVSSSLYIDLHLFTDTDVQWVVLFDNTEAAVRLQIAQQERLSNDIVAERSSCSN